MLPAAFIKRYERPSQAGGYLQRQPTPRWRRHPFHASMAGDRRFSYQHRGNARVANARSRGSYQYYRFENGRTRVMIKSRNGFPEWKYARQPCRRDVREITPLRQPSASGHGSSRTSPYAVEGIELDFVLCELTLAMVMAASRLSIGVPAQSAGYSRCRSDAMFVPFAGNLIKLLRRQAVQRQRVLQNDDCAPLRNKQFCSAQRRARRHSGGCGASNRNRRALDTYTATAGGRWRDNTRLPALSPSRT